MLKTRVRSKSKGDVPGKVTAGIERGLMASADVGFAVSQELVPSGATGGLGYSGVHPDWQGSAIVWGYTAEYAKYVEAGTSPHYPPIEPLKLWSHRVLGDEDAAYAVQEKIGQEGTEAQPYVGMGFEEMVRQLKARGLSQHIDAEFG